MLALSGVIDGRKTSISKMRAFVVSHPSYEQYLGFLEVYFRKALCHALVLERF